MSGPRLLWWADGTGQELVAGVGTRGRFLSIPKVSLTQALPPTPIGDQMRRTLSHDLDYTPPASDPIAELLEGFSRERYSSEAGADLAAAQYLTLVLLQLWRFARSDLVRLGGAPQGLSERFILLAGQRAREHWHVERYASELKVSRDRLGSAVKRATGLSPQAYIHRLLLREAMDLLSNTGTPVALVAFRLGFTDPAYFTRFFKRETGQNPGAYRKSKRKNKDENTSTFAAWP